MLICPARFNPRTPCEVRLAIQAAILIAAEVSIHAPLARCDGLEANIRIKQYSFNPRTPCEVRLLATNKRYKQL